MRSASSKSLGTQPGLSVGMTGGKNPYRNPFYNRSSPDGNESSPMSANASGLAGKKEPFPTSQVASEDGLQLCGTMQTESRGLDSVDDPFALECTQHSFDVSRAVDGHGLPGLKIMKQGPPSVPPEPGTPSVEKEDVSSMSRDRSSKAGTARRDMVMLPYGSRNQAPPDRSPAERTELLGAPAPNAGPPVPPLPLMRFVGDSFSGGPVENGRAWSRHGFIAEYEMFDRHRPHQSKDSHGSLNFIGSLAKVWSVNPNHSGSRAYRVMEVPISETASMISRFESGALSDTETLESALLDSVLDTAEYIGSEFNMYSSIQSIPEHPHEEDEFMLRVREAIKNAEMERMESSTTSASHLSWMQDPAMTRTLRDAHRGSVPSQNALIRTRTASPGGCFLPLPCVQATQQKDSSLFPNLVLKLGKSIGARSRRFRTTESQRQQRPQQQQQQQRQEEQQQHKKKSFAGLRRVFSKASRLLSGKKTGETAQSPEWRQTPPVENASGVICLPRRVEGSNFLIQSTMESWCSHSITESGHVPRNFQAAVDGQARPGRAGASWQQSYPSDTSPSMNNGIEEDNIMYFDTYGLFDRTRRNIGQSAVPSEVEAMEGVWILDRSRSDKVDRLCSTMNLDAAMTEFWKNVTCLEIQVLHGHFKTSMRVPAVCERVEEVPLNGKESFPQRCDLVNGKMCLSASLPSRGFLTFATWQHPYAGSREEHYWMEDENRRLCVTTCFEYKDGPGCKIKWVFKRNT